MSSRGPILAAASIALLALLVALWTLFGDDARYTDSEKHGLAAVRRSDGVGRVTLLKDRPVPPARQHQAGQAGAPEAPASDTPAAAPGAASGGVAADGEEAGAARQKKGFRTRAEMMADRRAARARTRAGSAASTESEVEVATNEVPGFGEPPPQPVPTIPAGSLYDGLSNDDMLELLVASRRVRDAGVFQRLSPDQFILVQEIMPDAQGVQDANEITQRILGMGVGDWLDLERGPKGRFFLR